MVNIAVIPGDGVGPEVSTEAVRVLEAAGKQFDFEVAAEWFDWGCDRFLTNGEMMPGDALDTLAGFDAIFLGCIGDANKVPDHISLEMLLGIRTGFDQYVNLRPIRLYPGVPTPVNTATPETVDFVVIRENTEGEYSRQGGFFKTDTPEGFALQTGVFTRKGCTRVIRYAFDLAEQRKQAGYPGRVTNCTKSNALNYSMVFWDQIYDEVAADHPGIQRDMALVDALTMWFVKNPDWFDVVVASNLFGDIVTDLGAMLQGGMGFAAGGNIDPERRHPSMFEPIHGSAPKYTGQGRVNPVASIEAVRMMLDHLGQTEAASAIGDAVAATLAAGEVRTRDIGGTSSTQDVGMDVARRLLGGVKEHDMSKVKVGVAGYGVIGTRLAAGVAVQEDMELVGVADVAPTLAVRALKERGMPLSLFTAVPGSEQALEAAGIPVSGSFDDLLGEVDVMLDAAPGGIGAKNKEKYVAAGVKAVFQGGEKAEVADVFFHGTVNYEQGLGVNYLKLTSCNTTGLIRAVHAVHQTVGVSKTFITIVRRVADPGDTHRGLTNVLQVEAIPNHQAVDLMHIIPEIDATGLLIHTPVTHGHIITLSVTPKQKVSVEAALEAFGAYPRIKVVRIAEGFDSNTSLFQWARYMEYPRGDMFEIGLWEEMVGLSGDDLVFAINIPQESVTIPETVDAVRAAMGMQSTGAEAVATTDRYLGI